MATSVDMHYKSVRIIDAAVASQSGTPTTNASDVKLSAVSTDGNVLSDMVVCHTNTATTENSVTTGNNHCNPKRYSGFDVRNDAGTSNASIQVGWRRAAVDGTYQAYATAPVTNTTPETNDIVTAGWVSSKISTDITTAVTRGFKEEVLESSLAKDTSYSVGTVAYTIESDNTSKNLHVYLDGVICKGGGTGTTAEEPTYTYYTVTGGANIKFYNDIPAGTRITIIVW